jgi:hypothetical protein
MRTNEKVDALLFYFLDKHLIDPEVFEQATQKSHIHWQVAVDKVEETFANAEVELRLDELLKGYKGPVQ